MLNHLFYPDHKSMAVLVRALGPELFHSLIEVKCSEELSPLSSIGYEVTLHLHVNRLAVLEYEDLQRAIASGAYTN